MAQNQNQMKREDMTAGEKNRIFQSLLHNSKDGKPATALKQQLASQFGCSLRTIQRICVAAQQKLSQDQAVVFMNNKKGKPHAKRVFLDEAAFLRLKPTQKMSIRSMSRELGISRGTIHKMRKQGLIVAHTNHVKPKLTDKNKLERMHFVLSQIVYDEDEHCFKFKEMFEVIHIDEKWFYMKQAVERYYNLPNQATEVRFCQSKRYIGKCMFLTAVGRPHFYNKEWFAFDGKIGNWALVQWVPAKRKSVNRPKDTLELKAIPGINKVITKKFMLEKVIPAIKAKWTEGASKNIIIQWDNAPPHIKNNDPDIREACSSDGFNIQLYFQPPNSPDCNINDVGWYRCMETVQWETRVYNLENLCDIVQESFESIDPEKLNKNFLSLQQNYIEILKDKGGNGYKQPHMGKDALIRAGTLPISLVVDEELIRNSIDYVLEHWDGQEVPKHNFYDLMARLRYDED